MIKNRLLEIVLFISVAFIIVGIILLDDTSFILIGTGIILFACAIRLFVIRYKDKLMGNNRKTTDKKDEM